MGKKEFVKKEQIDFSTLPKIMEHFFNVPFPQFQADLNEWFEKKMNQKEGFPDADIEHRHEITNHFLNLAKRLFIIAECKSSEESGV
jgi:hypothetical protein